MSGPARAERLRVADVSQGSLRRSIEHATHDTINHDAMNHDFHIR